METIKKKPNQYKFALILLGSIFIGSIIGIVFGEKAKVLKPFGDIFINAMFTIVVPLVFVTISSSMSSINSIKRLRNILKNLILVFVSTGLIASVLILVTVTIFPPAKGVNIDITETQIVNPLSTADQIVSTFTVDDFPKVLSKQHMLPLILFSIFFGISVNLMGEKAKMISGALDALSKVFIKMISILMYYAPIGLGAYFAAITGEYGKELIGSYARAMVIYYPLCFLYLVVFFPIYMYLAGGKQGIKSIKYLIAPIVTSISTQSSIATLPVNIEACEKIGVPRDISNIVLPIGATAHMDGTVISTVLKISFLFGIYGIPFAGVETYATAILLSLVGGMVMSGVPGGGLIGEMLIVSMYGFPPEAFPIIATIGYLVDPPATMINATGDTVASMLVTRLVEGKNWMIKSLS